MMTTIELSTRVDESIRVALEEDIGPGDATTDSIVPAHASLRGQIVAKQHGVVAGLEVARRVFQKLNEQVNFAAKVKEGELVDTRSVLVDLDGPARALLTGERTALNFLGRMSGIATATRQYMDAVAGTKSNVLFRVMVATDGSPGPDVLFSRRLDTASADGLGWQQIAIDLSPFAAETVSIFLNTNSEPGVRAAWLAPRIVDRSTSSSRRR